MSKKAAALLLILILLTATGCSSSSNPPAPGSDGVTDLTGSGYFMEYNQLYNIMHDWKVYEGQPIRLRCRIDPAKESDGFLCSIPDGTGCCSLKLELAFREEASGRAEKEAFILGTFHSYVRDGYRYCQIIDAEIEP